MVFFAEWAGWNRKHSNGSWQAGRPGSSPRSGRGQQVCLSRADLADTTTGRPRQRGRAISWIGSVKPSSWHRDRACAPTWSSEGRGPTLDDTSRRLPSTHNQRGFFYYFRRPRLPSPTFTGNPAFPDHAACRRLPARRNLWRWPPAHPPRKFAPGNPLGGAILQHQRCASPAHIHLSGPPNSTRKRCTRPVVRPAFGLTVTHGARQPRPTPARATRPGHFTPAMVARREAATTDRTERR